MDHKRILDFIDQAIAQNYSFERERLLDFSQSELLEIFSLMMLKVESRERELNHIVRNLEKIVAEQTGELREKNKVLQDLAIFDPLTQIYNRRYFDFKLKEYMELSTRIKSPLSCIISDIDHFKRVNDTFGHKAGDAVLQVFAEILKQNIRRTDVCARFGGEEFVIILPDTAVVQGAVLAEKLRVIVEETNFPAESRNLRVTSSFGVSQFRPDSLLEELVKSADSALYKAKRSGRNRVCYVEGGKIVKFNH